MIVIVIVVRIIPIIAMIVVIIVLHMAGWRQPAVVNTDSKVLPSAA